MAPSAWSKQRNYLNLGTQNHGCSCWPLRKLHFSKIIWRLALGFKMNLQLNATRRSINDSVYLVSDLEAGGFKFLERSKMSFPPFLQRVVTVKRKIHQIAQIRHFEPKTFCNEQTV